MARSRAGGYHCLGSTHNDLFNAPILALSKAIKGVMPAKQTGAMAGRLIPINQAVKIYEAVLK